MPHERFFIDSPLDTGGSVYLEDQEFHHLTHVMRAQVGQPIELVNGKNQLAQATISLLSKRRAELTISEVYTEDKSKPELILAQAIPRFNRLEYILEKATELDATQFWLFPGIFSEKGEFSENQHQRMAQLTIAAMKQCGRLDLPQVLVKPPLLKWEPLEGILLFGDTASDAPPLSAIDLTPARTVLFIGPERGFDPRETAFLKQTLRATGVSLHRNILRVDTAPLVGLSLLSQRQL